MKMLLIKIMLIMSMLISTVKNPLSIGILLILQTFMMTMLMNKMMKSSWFMMITFLMMIGGLLILFTYMCTIASNEKFKLNINISITLLIMLIFSEEMVSEIQINENLNLMKNLNEDSISMIKLYNEKSMMITMIMVMFLLLTMIVINKIVKLHMGPMRKKTYE